MSSARWKPAEPARTQKQPNLQPINSTYTSPIIKPKQKTNHSRTATTPREGTGARPVSASKSITSLNSGRVCEFCFSFFPRSIDMMPCRLVWPSVNLPLSLLHRIELSNPTIFDVCWALLWNVWRPPPWVGCVEKDGGRIVSREYT